MPSYDFVRLALLPDQTQETRVAYQYDVWQLTERLRRRGLTLTPAPHPGVPAPHGEPEAIARFLIAFPDLIDTTFETAATAWLDGTPGRRLVIGIGDVEVEAANAGDFHRLFAQARMLDDRQGLRRRTETAPRSHRTHSTHRHASFGESHA